MIVCRVHTLLANAQKIKQKPWRTNLGTKTKQEKTPTISSNSNNNNCNTMMIIRYCDLYRQCESYS